MKLTSTLAILSTISTLSFAFVLDYSCSAYQSMILPALAGAFDYTQAGADTLNNLATSNKGSGDIWQAQRDLINYTLADTLTNNEIDTANPQWKTAVDTFNSALKFNTNNAVTNKPSAYYLLKPDAVVIFCDYSRFHENHDCNGKSKPGWVCDKALMIDTPFLQGYDNCKTSAPNTARSTKAWVARLTPANRASTIQLCPGYLEEMVLYQKAMYNQHGRVFNLGKYIRPGPYPTRIDMLKTFDVSLAHEMIHAVENVEIKDIELPNSYMWPNVRRLSSKGTRNADNYAYFGLGSRLISPVAQPNGMRPQAVRPMADGSLQDLDGGSKRDVSNGDNLFGPRAMNQITTSSSDDTTASSLSGISTLAPAPTGSSCSPQVTSGCVLSYSIVTPTGASTAELSTITVSCTTITTCSVSLTDAASVTATPIYDQDVSEAWYATQESVLSEAATDTMDHYKTWSSDESTQAAATTQPASSSASIEDDC